MRAQAGSTGKGKGGRKTSELPAKITYKGKKAKPADKLTYVGRGSSSSTAKRTAKKRGR